MEYQTSSVFEDYVTVCIVFTTKKKILTIELKRTTAAHNPSKMYTVVRHYRKCRPIDDNRKCWDFEVGKWDNFEKENLVNETCG